MYVAPIRIDAMSVWAYALTNFSMCETEMAIPIGFMSPPALIISPWLLFDGNLTTCVSLPHHPGQGFTIVINSNPHNATVTLLVYGPHTCSHMDMLVGTQEGDLVRICHGKQIEMATVPACVFRCRCESDCIHLYFHIHGQQKLICELIN